MTWRAFSRRKSILAEFFVTYFSPLKNEIGFVTLLPTTSYNSFFVAFLPTYVLKNNAILRFEDFYYWRLTRFGPPLTRFGPPIISSIRGCSQMTSSRQTSRQRGVGGKPNYDSTK